MDFRRWRCSPVSRLDSLPRKSAAPGAVPSRRGAVFRIDHDEKFNMTTHMQYQPWKLGPWIGFNWRYDSGLVAGPAPCAGGNCANGPAGDRHRGDVWAESRTSSFRRDCFADQSCDPPTANPTRALISDWSLPSVAIRVDAASNTRTGDRKRRSQSSPDRAAEPLRCRCGT